MAEVNKRHALPFVWNGEAMVPSQTAYWQKRHADRWEEGETYNLVEHAGRSAESHNHQFAFVDEAWANLPEGIDFANASDLRKHALIMTGWRNTRVINCETPELAQRVAAFAKRSDEYNIMSVVDSNVVEFTAKSQSIKAMGKQDFQKSKQDILEWLAVQIGVEPDELAKNAKQAA